MRVHLKIVLALASCLFAIVAAADSITSVSPTTINFGASEEFLTINGSGFAGDTTLVVFDGAFSVEPSIVSATHIEVFVPIDVTFVPGQHSVAVEVTDSLGTRLIGPAFITVVDPGAGNGPPQLSIPEVFVAEATNTEGAFVDYPVSATSANGQPASVSCSPPPGSQFPLGTTNVHCLATDLNGSSSGSFILVVTDSTPPVVVTPGDIVSTQPVVTFSVSATDNLDGPVGVTCTPASGSTFSAGTTPVTCVALDAHFNPGLGFFDVTVTDGAPRLTVPDRIVTPATGPGGATVTYDVTATGGATISCSAASGSTFALGVTAVTCTATNAFGTDTGQFLVEVYDGFAPVLVLHDVTVTATSPAGAVVTFNPTAIDDVAGSVPVICAPPSGNTFPIGVTTVTCVADDGHANLATGTFKVTVLEQDTTPPVLMLTNVTAEATSPAGAIVTFTPTAVDETDGSVPVTCAPASGSTFALGDTLVQCSASDAHGNTAFGSFTVSVVDTTPPVISDLTATPNELWPPNHKMVAVDVSAVVFDAVDPSPLTHIIAVTSNQPVNGTGDGDTAPDWIIMGPVQVQLRSERSSGIDRKYTILVESTDEAGNSSTATVEVNVTQAKRRAVH